MAKLTGMDAAYATRLQALLAEWVSRLDDLRALALCGSWARGDARPDSDLDLLVFTNATGHDQLVTTIPFDRAGFHLEACRWETYGAVRSAHMILRPEAELELSFAKTNWASIDPIDAGTRRVVSDGFTILIDKDNTLGALLAASKL